MSLLVTWAMAAEFAGEDAPQFCVAVVPEADAGPRVGADDVARDRVVRPGHRDAVARERVVEHAVLDGVRAPVPPEVDVRFRVRVEVAAVDEDLRLLALRAVGDVQPAALAVVVLVPVDRQVADAAVVGAVGGEQQVLVGVPDTDEHGRAGDGCVVGVGARRHALQDRPLSQHQLADPVGGVREEDHRAGLVPLVDRGLDRLRVVGLVVALRAEREHRDGTGVTGHGYPPR